MKHLKTPLLLVAFGILIGLSAVSAREYETYRGEITVPILENDIVLARNNAFSSLQNLLLTAAIQDLIGPTLYQEYQSEISRNNTLEASRFLVSAKVLSERSEEGQFTMKLEGRIRISTLSDVLRGMNLVLKDDPWFPVTVIVDSTLNLSPEHLKQRLALFHLRVNLIQNVDLEGIPWRERSTTDFIEALFMQFGQSGILYFIDTVTGEDGKAIKGIRNQVFRQSDLSIIDSFQLDIPVPRPIHELDDQTLNRFLRLYSITSIDIDHFEEGLESTLILQVAALHNPFEFHQFEEKILKANRSIKSFIITKKSVDFTEYRIESKQELDHLLDFFNRKNPDYYFITEKIASNILLVEAFDRSSVVVNDLIEWDPDQRILDMIKETINTTDDEEEKDGATAEESQNLFENAQLTEEHLPQLTEKEPNNNSQNLNALPSETLVLGYVSSRADEDIFQISRDMESSTLVVEWLQIGKTTLSPQLRLYDDTFSFINNFKLLPSRQKIRFVYTFKQTPPRKLHLRITDRIGFIQGETGGFKYFYFLLRYYWQTENSVLEPSG